MRKTKRVIAMLLTAVFVMLSFICVPFEADEVAKAKDYEDVPIVLSLGDSYSSGEGCESFYYQDLPWEEKVKKDDWLAHRSMNSWPGMLKFNGKQLKGYKYENDGNFEGKRWFFQAVSGAETKNIYSNKTDLEEREKDKQRIKYVPSEKWRDMIPSFNTLVVKLVVAVKVVLTEIKEKKMPFQLDIVDEIKKETGEDIDYVTITIGGNDMGFADIITAGVISSPVTNTRWLLSFQLHEAWKKFGDGEILRDTYKAIADKTGKDTTIIVVGYPELLDRDGKDLFFSPSESEEINKNVREFNEKIEGIVKELQKDMNIHFVSVKDEFKEHKAYSSEPYINPIMLTRSEDVNYARIPPISAYSIHPNYIEGGKDGEPNCGVEAYAKAVQEKIDWLEKKEAEKNSINKKAKKAYAQYLSNIYNAAYDVNDDYVDVRWDIPCVSYDVGAKAYYDDTYEENATRHNNDKSPGNGKDGLSRFEYYGMMDIDGDDIDELLLGRRYIGVGVGDQTYVLKYEADTKTVRRYGYFDYIDGWDKSDYVIYKDGSVAYSKKNSKEKYGRYAIKKDLLDKYLTLVDVDKDGYESKCYDFSPDWNNINVIDLTFSSTKEGDYSTEYKDVAVDILLELSAEKVGTMTNKQLDKLLKELEAKGRVKNPEFKTFNYENLSMLDGVNIEKKVSPVNLYENILNKYKTAIVDDWSADKIEKEFGLQYAWKIYGQTTVLDEMFYGFYDIDKNGTPELIVSGGTENNTIKNIYAYDYEKGEAVLLISYTTGRESVTIYNDGTVVDYGIGGAFRLVYVFYDYGKNGVTDRLILRKMIGNEPEDDMANKKVVWYFCDGDNMWSEREIVSEEEARSVIDEYTKSGMVEIEYDSFRMWEKMKAWRK